ncbi:MAG: ABC transporter permease [Bacteroidota bacterium]
MGKYILRRLLLAIVTFFSITVIVFFMSYMAPGSPIDYLLVDPTISAEELTRRAAQLGLHQPVYVQYFSWLGQLLHGNLGFSYRTYRSVTDMIAECLGNTLLLTFSSLLIAYLIAIPIGIYSARKPYSSGDFLSATGALLAMAMPGFVVGMFFIFFFSVKLGWLPMSGMYSSNASKSALDLVLHLIMPSICLAIQQIGHIMRQMRSSMLDILNEDYIRAARAKGLSDRRVVYTHALRNALAPMVTLFGTSVPFLVGGAVVTEQVFTWPGIGSLMVSSITARDYPVIMGITGVVAVAVLIGNLLVDITYGILDPKIRYN